MCAIISPIFLLMKIASGPCILRPLFQPEEHGLKLKVVLKCRVIYTDNITIVLLDGWSLTVKWMGP